MTIKYIDPAPRYSDAVVYNNTIYYTSVPEDLAPDANIQTHSALDVIDAMLARLGSSRTRILDATIFLADKADFEAMNKAWDAWVTEGSAPVRCTVEAGLMNPNYKVEIKIIAAVCNEADLARSMAG